MLEQLEQLAARDERREARAARTVPAKRTTKKRTEKERRSDAAKRGWEKRRANAVAHARKTVKTNPLEVDTGEWGYILYDDAHPLHGDANTIAEWDAHLRPYYGKRIRLSLNGFRTHPHTHKTRRIFIRRVGMLENYSSFFGPGSLYAKALKIVRDIASEEELVINSVTIEEADADDADSETVE